MTACEDDEYTCNDGNCIRMDERCDSKTDCRDESDEEDCLKIKTFSGYNKLAVPRPLEGQHKFTINYTFIIDKIVSIDERNGEFKIRISWIRTWYNPHLKFPNLKRNQNLNQLSEAEKDTIWVPWTVFNNVLHRKAIQSTDRKAKLTVVPNSEFNYVKSDSTYLRNTRLFLGSENFLNYTQTRTDSVRWACLGIANDSRTVRWCPTRRLRL